jgi:hypothetical protein
MPNPDSVSVMADIVGMAKDIATVLGILVAGIMAVFVYFQLAPVLQLRILPRWADDNRRFLILRFEMENKSRVRMRSPWGRIQVLRHKVEPGESLSRWVPFDKDSVKPAEHPIEWVEPIEIFTSTQEIYPGETIAFERLHHCPEEPLVLHVGLQVGLELTWLKRVITGKKRAWRQTTTCFVAK